EVPHNASQSYGNPAALRSASPLTSPGNKPFPRAQRAPPHPRSDEFDERSLPSLPTYATTHRENFLRIAGSDCNSRQEHHRNFSDRRSRAAAPNRPGEPARGNVALPRATMPRPTSQYIASP